MKRLILPTLVIGFVLVLAGFANAGSWWIEYGTSSGQPGDTRTPAPSNFPQLNQPPWGNPNTALGQGTPSPHLGFSTASNLCKTCHAVHLADATSYRLLHDTSRMTECDWCHDASTGRSGHRPYAEMSLAGATVRGEHTLKTTYLIPDSDLNRGLKTQYGVTDDLDAHEKGLLPNRSIGPRNGQNDTGLNCWDCHSVHGANVISDTYWHAAAIIREDPAGDGDKASDNPSQYGSTTFSQTHGVRTAFCADCHTLNPNWDANAADDVDIAGGEYANPRPNPRSHVQGPAADGQMEAYHQVITDSWPSATTGKSANRGCRGCHSGSEFEDWMMGLTGPGDWPHQTTGSKLLMDNYDGEMGVAAGDPQRPLKNMDQVCLDCHRDSTGNLGVGKTF